MVFCSFRPGDVIVAWSNVSSERPQKVKGCSVTELLFHDNIGNRDIGRILKHSFACASNGTCHVNHEQTPEGCSTW
jgi:hypothetical protein